MTATQRIPVAPPYHLARTLISGQCFRWVLVQDQEDADSPPVRGPVRARGPVLARGVVDGTVAAVTQSAGGLTVRWEGPAGSLSLLRHHLGADEPLAEVEAALERDPVLARLLPHTSGIALMSQDPWECLVSFVISSFNNIPKITRSVRLLARRFGERITDDDWAFPTAERLAEAGPDALRACILGYRARYVAALARLVARGEVDLAAVSRHPYDEARRALLALPGVGEKVAECVLLFALGHRDAFPVDVWVQRAVEAWYLGGREADPKTVRAWARDRFGPLAGYAQQHLFVGARLGLAGPPRPDRRDLAWNSRSSPSRSPMTLT